MADMHVPHFKNDLGIASIRVGTKEFMCVGATPPFDHPHIFIDMGDDTETVCPYCSTLYIFEKNLAPGTSEPLSAVYQSEAA